MIYLIITTCIHNRFGVQNYEQRKLEYLTSIAKTISFLRKDIKVIIVENNGKRPTYLDMLGVDVHYTTNNSNRYIHKGINELQDIHSVIQEYGIQDDDTVIKLTGRYHLLNDSFIKTVIENQEYDGFVKYFNVCSLTFEKEDCVLGLYAMKCHKLKQFRYSGVSPQAEIEFAKFTKNLKIYEVKDLGLRCCFADNLRILDV
jgi:hypothetical protein